MRVRLQATVLSLVALLVFGLGVPLAVSVAGRAGQTLFLDRLTDTARFASLAQRPLIQSDPDLINAELRRYAEVYGIAVAVLNQDGRPTATSGTVPGAIKLDLADTRVAGQVQSALAGRHSEPGPMLVPWDEGTLVLAEPVLIDGDVRGVVVTESPTAQARQEVTLWWVLIATVGMIAFCLALLVALPLVRWILRPVRRLDEATGSLVEAVVSGREVARVGEESGPVELQQLGRSFDMMAASVGEALAAQRAFVADASHQLRNPLTALKLRLVNLEGHVDTEAEEHREAAVAEADRLNQVLDGLLSMARAEASAGELVAVDVDTVVAERAADWNVVAVAREVSLDVEGSTDGVRALAPPRGLEAVLDALLDNALKFTGAGTSVCVRTSTVDTGDTGKEMVRLTVRDHGPGLRADELERATDRFWRSTAHQNVAGSGLGLSIVAEIVARAGGSLKLDLPDGGGLRIAVELPAASS
ncbi:sensor histidine kinase [Amycolatopsis lurida]